MNAAGIASHDWVEVLDDLDTFVTRAEMLIVSDPSTVISEWRPPADLGTLPAEMLDRASRLLMRQESLQARLEEASTSVLNARALTQVVVRSASPKTPSFVDERA